LSRKYTGSARGGASHRALRALAQDLSNDGAGGRADGNVVMVWVDPATGASVPLPQAIRSAAA
jgi:acyl-CoA thioesterase FadM